MSNFALVSFFLSNLSLVPPKVPLVGSRQKKTALTQKRFQSEKMRKIEMEVSKL